MDFELEPYFQASLPSAEKLKNDILSTNEKALEYGLTLSEQDAEMLAQASREAVEAQDRVEFGKSVSVKIIEKFMQSSYISQNGYAETLAELIDIFYEVKEESLDILTDDEVINIMYAFFEQESGGDIDVLRSRDLEYLCRRVRNEANGVNK